MPNNSSLMSREQQITREFGSTISQVRPYLSEIEGGTATFDALIEAILRFGSCELRMRRAGRLEALGLADAEAAALRELALDYHEKGLGALSAVRPFAQTLIAEGFDGQMLSRWQDSSGEIRAEWTDQVSQLDVSAGDAEHLMRIMSECCDAMDEEGLAGLGRYLARVVDELEETRRSDDRGTRATSFPWWKIVAAAAIVGMTAYAVWTLVVSGAPWWSFFLVALVASIMLLLVALGC